MPLGERVRLLIEEQDESSVEVGGANEFVDKAATGFQLLCWTLGAPQAELLAKVLNMFVAMVALVVFSALANHLRRQWLLSAQ